MVGHYQRGHWDVAACHFAKAVKADPQFGGCSPQFRPHARQEVKKALELASNDPLIRDFQKGYRRQDVKRL
jgi:hypothetical protein